MAIARVQFLTATPTSGALTWACSSAPTPGNLLILFVSFNGIGLALTPTAGWTTGWYTNSATDSFVLLYRVAQSGDTASMVAANVSSGTPLQVTVSTEYSGTLNDQATVREAHTFAARTTALKSTSGLTCDPTDGVERLIIGCVESDGSGRTFSLHRINGSATGVTVVAELGTGTSNAGIRAAFFERFDNPTVTGNYTAEATASVADDGYVGIMVFKAAVTANTLTPPLVASNNSFTGATLILYNELHAPVSTSTVTAQVASIGVAAVISAPVATNTASAPIATVTAVRNATLSGALPSSTATAPAAALQGSTSLIALTATATTAAGTASLVAGGRIAPLTIPTSTASAPVATMPTGTLFSAVLATTTTTALAAAISTLTVLSALTAIVTATAPTAGFASATGLAALTATSTAAGASAALLAGQRLTALTATTTATSPSSALLGGARWAAPAATTTAVATPAAALSAGSGLVAQTALASAQAEAGLIKVSIVGTSAITVPRPLVAGIGVVPLTGSGVVTMPAPGLGAAGSFYHHVGPANVVIERPSMESVGISTNVGVGEIVMPAPTLSGAGAGVVEGLSGIVIDVPALSGVGSLPFSGIGALTLPAPTIAASGGLAFAGTGGVLIARPSVDGLAPLPPPAPPPPLLATDIHVIEVFNIEGVFLGRVQPIRRARFTMVENDVGDFEIELPWIYDDVINIMQTRNRLEYSIKGVKVFGGIILKRLFRQEGRYSMVTLSGPGYNGFLTGRIIVPPPGDADDVYTGLHADDLIKAIVRRHLGELAPVERRAIGFVVAEDLGQSAFITNYTGRYEPVIDALKNIVKEATDTRFLTVRNEAGLLEFRTYVPIIGQEHGIGQPDTVLFDVAGGNALNVEYVEDGTALRNYIYGGGPGEDAARMIREGFNAESIAGWGRIEDFLDSSGVETTSELDLEILKKLEETSRGGPSLSFTVGQAGRYEYPLDFAFGDRVSAIWKEAGLTLTDVISGMTITLEENGVLGIEMSIGAPNLFRLAPGRALARFIRGLRGEVGLMQRR